MPMTDEIKENPATNAPVPSETEATEQAQAAKPAFTQVADQKAEKQIPKEIGGSEGPEPTRYGDWEHKGIASDF